MNFAIKGAIVSNEDKWIYDLFGFEATSPKDVAGALEQAGGEDVVIEVSSPGGDVIAANEIYYAISMYNGSTTADITGWAASAASYLSLAANRVRMLPTAMFMIHNVSGSARGDYRVMDKESKVLKGFNKAISNAYRLKTGLSESELLSLMDKESWLTAAEAMEKGFIDEIIGADNGALDNTVPAAVYNAAFAAPIIPKEKINALKEMLVSSKLSGQELTGVNPKEKGHSENVSDSGRLAAEIRKFTLF